MPMLVCRRDEVFLPFGRRLACCRCGAREWIELTLTELDRQRQAAVFEDWMCDRCVDREMDS
jgi:hypothetical protein